MNRLEAQSGHVLEVGRGWGELAEWISMSPFVADLPEVIDEPFFARRANSIFVAENAA